MGKQEFWLSGEKLLSKEWGKYEFLLSGEKLFFIYMKRLL